MIWEAVKAEPRAPALLLELGAEEGRGSSVLNSSGIAPNSASGLPSSRPSNTSSPNAPFLQTCLRSTLSTARSSSSEVLEIRLAHASIPCPWCKLPPRTRRRGRDARHPRAPRAWRWGRRCALGGGAPIATASGYQDLIAPHDTV